MGDYNSAYAWDGDGCAITLEGLGIAASAQLEAEFEAWASHLWDVNDKPERFPWNSFNERGLELARKLRSLLDPDVVILYRKHVQDITRDEWQQRTIEHSHASLR
jgi:hypothetical protein